MNKRYRWRLLTLLVMTCFVIPYSGAETLVFKQGDHSLSGEYLEATGAKPTKAVILFVHGDGATSYNAEGYYELIWQPLREKGYAIFSWDKPSVGQSTGNWLNQSMADRQLEVLAAIDAVQHQYGFTAENTGLLGFSQAGWVLPALANKPEKVGFMIGIGFAANWVEQGRYYTQTRHELAGSNPDQVAAALAAYTEEITFFKGAPSYREYAQFAGQNAMSEARYAFVLNNHLADATQDYANINVPSLLLWGDKDLNVNAQQEFQWWQNQSNPLITTKLIANANHSMLDAESFDEQSLDFKQWLKLMWLEQEALAADFLPTLMTWLDNR